MKKIDLISVLFMLMCVFTTGNLQAQDNTPLDIALRYLNDQKAELGLSTEDLAQYRISDMYQSNHNGVTHIYLIQQHEGLDLHNAILNINILPDGRILNFGNRFVMDLHQKANTAQPVITPESAVNKVLTYFNVPMTGELQAKYNGVNNRAYVFDKAGIALDDINVDLMYTLDNTGNVRLAWQVDVYEMDAQNWWVAR